jgi:hypothetical protein
MTIAMLCAVPQFPKLEIESGSHSSSETRLDFSLSLSGDRWTIIDQLGASLTDAPWALRLYDAASSVHAESDQTGAGSVRYRPPSPSDPDQPGGCVVQTNLSPTGFSSLLASCLAGKPPECVYLEVDGFDEQEDGVLRWDRAANPLLVVTAIRMSLYL